MTLTADDFVRFHEAIHGYPPFPWQRAVADHILTQRRFPDLVDVPTGAGKTTMLDIAIFALAADAERPPEERWVPRRTFLVVDRRVVVDQAGERAMQLARALEAPTDPVVQRVAGLLRSLTDGGPPVISAALRGGTLRDDEWARSPDQPVLGASTVDQVGSRLLFMGYGVAPRAAAMHAGLLGRDTLFLLDEVHLSQPFRDTLHAVARYDRWAERPVGVSNQVVELSATPGAAAGRLVASLSDDDLAHPVLRERLDARKPVRLELASSSTTKAIADTCVRQARDLLQRHRTVVVVVNRVATAREAHAKLAQDAERRGYDTVLLTGRMRPLDRQDLLDRYASRIRAGRVRTGDERPLVVVATQCIEAGADFDFDAIVSECASLDALRQRFGRVDRLGRYHTFEDASTSGEGAGGEGIAGAGIHTDDARTDDRSGAAGGSADPAGYGALAGPPQHTTSGADEPGGGSHGDEAPGDRDTERSTGHTTSQAAAHATDEADVNANAHAAASVPSGPRRRSLAEGVIVAGRSDITTTGKPDPVYGYALAHTWQWLEQLAERGAADLGPGALPPNDNPALLAPREQAPILLPVHLDAWCQTAPRPALQPDPSLWLHGRDDIARDVQLVWRADVTEEELLDAALEAAPERRSAIVDRLTAVPPSGLEALSVPIAAARAWLATHPSQRGEADVADVEGFTDTSEPDMRPRERAARPFLAWRGDESAAHVDLGALRPGMTLVVPARYGGLSGGTWSPDATAPVPDLGDRAQLMLRGRATLRLLPDVSGAIAPGGPRPSPDDSADIVERLRVWLAATAARGDAPAWLATAAGWLEADLGARRGRRPLVRELSDGHARWYVVVATARRGLAQVRALRERELERAGGAAAAPGGPLLDPLLSDFDELEASSFIARRVPLREHLDGVAALAAAFARNVGLAAELARDVELAAALHDVGKADARFQCWLHGGDEIGLAVAPEPLAKSSLPAQDARNRRAARARAGYPDGMRHEALSAAMASGHAEVMASAHDAELVLHLIASHHGHARPLLPPVIDERPIEVTYADPRWAAPLAASSDMTLAALDSGVAERFWRLVRRYGWHGLAHLESIVRLADHRRSQQEEEQG